jgi:hypothetical protein
VSIDLMISKPACDCCEVADRGNFGVGRPGLGTSGRLVVVNADLRIPKL